MAVVAEAKRLTEQQRLLQVRIAAATALELRELWRLVDLENLDSTVPTWMAAVQRLVTDRHSASIAVATRYFAAFRVAEYGQPYTGTLPVPGMSTEALQTSLLVTGPIRIRQALSQGRTLTEAGNLALVDSTAAATRHALNGGRDTLTGAVTQDQRALGWARVTSVKPCAFCAMLASRGPVYREATARFQAHDSCRCTAEPVYRRNAPWPGRSQQWADLYKTQASTASDPTSAFRRAYEAA
jgi:hypothetical protein